MMDKETAPLVFRGAAPSRSTLWDFSRLRVAGSCSLRHSRLTKGYREISWNWSHSMRERTKETSGSRLTGTQKREVRFGSLADIRELIRHVRFTPESGHAERRH